MHHIRKVKTMPVNFTGEPLCSYFDECQKNEIYFLSVLELNTQWKILLSEKKVCQYFNSKKLLQQHFI